MNDTKLFGRFVKKPELRKTPNERSVTSFTLAVDRDYRKDGEIVTDFFDCTAWEKNAENICKWCDKGHRILITSGRLSNQPVKYTNKNNVEISYTKTVVVVEKFKFIERRSDSGNTSQDNAQQNDNVPAPVPMPPQTEYAADMDITDDDYPF